MKRIMLSCAILLLFVSCVHFVRTGTVTETREIVLDLSDRSDCRFYDGMVASENCWPDPGSNRLYVTTLNGELCMLDGPSGMELSRVKTLRPGGYVLGIALGADGFLYAAVCPGTTSKEWSGTGGYVARISHGFDAVEPLTGSYPSINGLTFDSQGRGYFATGNFNFVAPRGRIMEFTINPDGTVSEPKPASGPMGLANGLFWDTIGGRLLYTDTLETAGVLDSETGVRRVLYRKTAMKEAFDDLCVDAQGRLWMTDPIRPTLKVYDPEKDLLIRYFIKGFGQASSCRIRVENGKEILYLTELAAPVKERKNRFNGRGVLRVPLECFPE
jgi:sugar lactone lactonase YvrE